MAYKPVVIAAKNNDIVWTGLLQWDYIQKSVKTVRVIQY